MKFLSDLSWTEMDFCPKWLWISMEKAIKIKSLGANSIQFLSANSPWALCLLSLLYLFRSWTVREHGEHFFGTVCHPGAGCQHGVAQLPPSELRKTNPWFSRCPSGPRSVMANAKPDRVYPGNDWQPPKLIQIGGWLDGGKNHMIIQTCGEERLFNVIHARHKRQPTGLHHLPGM